ncbi:MAG: hypothetical protein ACI4UN_06765 [Muribaculaceae bacterium]
MKINKIIKRTLKIGGWMIGGIAVLLIVAMCAVAWILTPQRLTPIVNRLANENLNANVKIGRVELTTWSTFPHLMVDIDSLTIVSGSLKTLPADSLAMLPAGADSLLAVSHVHGGINVLRLLYGTFSLVDVAADDLNLNLVDVSATRSNYLISLPSDEPADESPLELPTLFWDNMALRGNTRIAYCNVADTIGVGVRVKKLELNNTEGDTYRLDFAGDADYAMCGLDFVKNLPFTFVGNVNWNSDKPMDVAIEEMNTTLLDVPAQFSLAIRNGNTMLMDSFDADLGPVKFASVMEILPEVYSQLFSGVKSDIQATIKAHLTEPYDLLGTDMPSIDASMVIPESFIAAANGKARIDRVAMAADVSLKGSKPDKSTFSLKQLILQGEAVSLQLSANADNVFTDPHVKGKMQGSANIERVVRAFNLPLNFTVRGDLTADATVDAHMSDLTANRFQRVSLDGTLGVKNLFYNSDADTISLYARNMNLKFGNNDQIQINGKTVDNLMRFTADIDTMAASASGMIVTMKNGRAGIGCIADGAYMRDTTSIVPIGLRVRSERLSMEQADGTRIRMRDIDCGGSISRYEGDVKVPKLQLGMNARRLSYKDNTMRVALSDNHINLSANMRKRDPRRAERMKQRIDSIRAAHPEWSNDSVLQVASHRRKAADPNAIDFSVDDGLKKMIMQWNLHGTLSSAKGRLFTPYFPLRSTISNMNADFSIDSVSFKRMSLKSGQTGIDVSGEIRNIRSALMGSTRRPLTLDLFVKADTLNFNELIKAATDGLTFANSADGLQDITDSDNIDIVEEQVASTTGDDSTMMALVVPGNIDANIRLRAQNILYADLFMNRFNGNLLVHDGVLNLNELKARTDIGTARFNAMYAAPDIHNIRMGFDLSLSDIQVGRFLKMVPKIDSIMPLLESVDGVIDADLAATSDVDSAMNLVIPSLKAVMKLHGKDLVFMDAATFKKVAKMLLFKNKERNVVDEMTVEMLVENSQMELFPFMFDIDRYRLGVLGHNDLDLNFRYHISVLKSPIPFKFGINIYGNPDKMHFRFGGAKYKDKMAREKIQIVDTTRVNLREQINSALHRGAKAALKSELQISNRPVVNADLSIDSTSFSHEDSLMMIKGGFFEAPPAPKPSEPAPEPAPAKGNKTKTTNKSAVTRKD